MMYVEPRTDQIAALAALPQHDGPVEMINLLRFSPASRYPGGSGHAPCSGREAYLRYGAAVQPHLARVGGEVVWYGQPLLMFIGPDDKHWDEVLIARYPDIAAFLAMVTDPGYLEIAVHRSAALLDSRLLVTRPGSGLVPA